MENLGERLKRLKSVQVYETESDIREIIRQRLDKNPPKPNQRAQTSFDDDSAKIEKLNTFGALKIQEAEGNLGVPTVEELKRKFEARDMPWRDEAKDRFIPYWGSDERVDGQGDIVRQNWVMDEFEKNSPMPFSHGWSMPPVGRVVDWKVVDRSTEKSKESSYKGPALWLLGHFATADDWEWADTVYRLAKARILVGGSVGFYSDKVIDVKDQEEREELGLGRFGLIFDKNHLLEYSPCTIPANSGAGILSSLRKARDSGGLEAHDINLLRELNRESIYGSKNDKQRWYGSETLLISAAKALFPDEKFELHRDLDIPVILNTGHKIRDNTMSLALDDFLKFVKQFDEFSTEIKVEISELREALEKAVQSKDGSGGPSSSTKVATELADRINRIKSVLG